MHKSLSNITISKPSIVLDLDETIVYATPLKPKDLDNNHFFTINFKKRVFYVQIRPNLQHFLNQISKQYDIFFYTSSEKDYASQIIDKIMPKTKQNQRFYRDSCKNIYGYFVKDLNVIKRPIKRVLLIDDSAGSAILNPANLIRIKPWEGEKNDNILLNLLPILESIALENDLRSSFIEAIKKRKVEGIDTF